MPERERREHSERKPRQKFFKKKVCKFCSDKTGAVEYKETEKIVKFLTEKGKIIPRRISGNCAKHQRRLAKVIKMARYAAIVPFQTS